MTVKKNRFNIQTKYRAQSKQRRNSFTPFYDNLKPKNKTKEIKTMSKKDRLISDQTKYLQEHIEELIKRKETFTLTPVNSPKTLTVIDENNKLIEKVFKVDIIDGELVTVERFRTDEKGDVIFNKEKTSLEAEILSIEDMVMTLSFKEKQNEKY